jgi:tetratricopeptide (TPR) repeat protein
VKSAVTALLVLTLATAGAVATYQAMRRERDYRALLARGNAALRDDETFGAIEAYSGAIALRPDSMLPHLRRGETYLRRGELSAAARDLQAAVVLDPTATRPLDELGDVKYLQQRFKRAAEIYDEDLRLDDRAALIGYKRALALYRSHDLDAALASLEAALRVNDHMAEAYYLRGLCLSEQRRTVQATRAFEKATALSPTLIPAREELAFLYGALGRHEDQIDQLQMLAVLDREHDERRIAVGLAHARWSLDQREPEATRATHADLAVLVLNGALKRSADQPAILTALGRAWLDVAQARRDPFALSKAIEALERVAARPDATSETLTAYGRALLEDGRADLAERHLRLATERYPIEPAAFLFHATAAEQRNHLDAARQSLIRYGALVNEEEQLVQRASRISALSLKLNDAATARIWLQRAVAASPNDPVLLASLAEAQLKLGERAAALATIAKGLEKDPDNAALLVLNHRVH